MRSYSKRTNCVATPSESRIRKHVPKTAMTFWRKTHPRFAIFFIGQFPQHGHEAGVSCYRTLRLPGCLPSVGAGSESEGFRESKQSLYWRWGRSWDFCDFQWRRSMSWWGLRFEKLALLCFVQLLSPD